MGRLSEARRCLQQSQAINQQLGSLIGIGIIEGLLGEVDLAESKWDQAEERFARAQDISCRLGNRWRQAWLLDLLARLRQAQGRVEEANAYHSEAQRLCQTVGIARQ
jgi:hypothetical protein